MKRSASRSPRLFTALLCLPFLLVPSACGRTQRMVVYVEDYWREFLLGRPDAQKELRAAARRRGWRFETAAVDGAYGGIGMDWRRLEEPLSEGAAMAVLSPFMMPIAVEMARRNPGVAMIFPGALPEAERPPANLSSIVFDRGPAYRQAGEWLGRRLTVERSAGEPPVKAAIIVSRESPRADAEIAAFREGFLEVADEYLLLTRRVEDENDAIKVRALMEDGRAQGARFFLLKLHRLLPTCLDFLEKEGGMAIVEDWERSGGYARSVVMSVEEDYVESVKAALAASDGGGVIPGSVRLVIVPPGEEGKEE